MTGSSLAWLHPAVSQVVSEVAVVPSAHGIGGQRDLPVPLNLAVAGAVAALVVSFGVLALAWRRPRYATGLDPRDVPGGAAAAVAAARRTDAATGRDSTNSVDGTDDGPRGRAVPEWFERFVRSTAWLVVCRAFGMVAFVYTVFVALVGKDTVINPFFGIIFVLLWVGIVPASLLLGPFYKAISPVRTINRLFALVTRGDATEGLFTYSPRVGLWPAAVGLYAFVWLELVYPYSTELGPVRLWFTVYVAVMLVGGALFGDRFYENADPFEVYSSFVAKLSVWGERDGRLVVRSPLANLSTLWSRPGLVAVIAVLFGSTGYDSFKDSSRWIGFVQSSSISGHVLGNIGLIVFVLTAGAVFSVATMLTGVHATPTEERPDGALGRLVAAVRARTWLPAAFAHSIIPIVIGYIVAHYLSFAFDVGSRTVILISDPLSDGSNWFGTANWSDIVWWSFHPTLLAVTKVLAVVIGHIVAAVAAHDRALRLLPPRHQLTGQLPLLIAMVAFTFVGLYLLFAA